MKRGAEYQNGPTSPQKILNDYSSACQNFALVELLPLNQNAPMPTFGIMFESYLR